MPDAWGDDPWGAGSPPAVADEDLEPLPPRLAEVVAAFAAGDRLEVHDDWDERPGARDLPEVAELVAQGWEPLVEGPGSRLDLLPAVWPAEHRCWVRDRSPRLGVCSYGEGETYVEPDHRNPEREHWELIREARSIGLPPPPSGRLWLLRSPWPGLGVASLLRVVEQVSQDEDLGWDRVAVLRAAQRVLAGDEATVWARWHGPRADAARSWRDAGAGPVDSERWVAWGLSPADLERLRRPLPDGGAGLPLEHVVRWVRALCFGGDPRPGVVEAAVAWRRCGLPVEVTGSTLARLAMERQPDEVAAWLDDGFTAEDVVLWEGQERGVARRWRDAGFDARTARDLVRADPALTPDEALAYEAVGIDPTSRRRWVETGFPPAAARAWTDLDVVPAEARVWRSLGKGPDDARRDPPREGEGLPPGFEGGWGAVGPGRDDRSYGVVDPPGTRGSVAGEGGPRWGGPPPDEAPV